MGGTINQSGPANRPPPLQYRAGFNESLIDGFIKDGWVDPDLRWQEVCALYQGQIAAERRVNSDRLSRIEAEAYAADWVNRLLEYEPYHS